MWAQENYINHTIQKGENVYRISKKYDVSVNAIYELNPGSQNVIYPGRTLKIPNANKTAILKDTQVSNYQVKRGETKYSLAKRFGVSIVQLEQQNPHIIKMLQVGHIINVDKSLKEGEHVVAKGETLSEIAKNNGISVEQLVAANSELTTGVSETGQIITIPEKKSEVSTSGEYIVKQGDTKFILSKRFNMSITALENKNPHIVKMLRIGQKLQVNTVTDKKEPKIETRPDSNNTAVTEDDSATLSSENENNATVQDELQQEDLSKQEKLEKEEEEEEEEEEIKVEKANQEDLEKEENPSPLAGNYINYTIKDKETLYSLAKKADMTIDEFTALNPKLLTSVNKGNVIKMPKSVIETSDSATNNKNTTQNTEVTSNTVKNTTPKVDNNKNRNLLDNLVTNTSSGIYFYSPFSSDELSSPEERKKMLAINSEFQKYIEFFQGAQIAIDSAKALNLDFDVTLIKTNIAKTQLDIESPHKKNAILVPFFDGASAYPSIISNEKISLIDIESNMTSIDSITIYKSIPDSQLQKTKTLAYLAKQNGQVIVLSDNEEAENKDLILNTFPDAKFLKVDNSGFSESDALENALIKDQVNYVIFDSDKTIVFLNSTTALMSKLANYQIQLVMLESSLLPNQSQVSDMRYRILKLIFPTVTDRKNKSGINNFETNYETIFEVEPTRNAALGFDVTLDIILRLSQNTSLEETINTIDSEQPHLRFKYKKTEDNNYINTGIYLMQYNSDEGMIILD